jgi:hypothetical protein
LWAKNVFSSVPLHPTVVDLSLDPSTFTLSWFDDFSGATLDTNQWNILVGVTGGATSTLQNVGISKGNLYLQQGNDSSVANGYSIGRLNSVSYFGYGFFEARIQFPNISGFHESFFLLARQTFQPPAFNPEIDIVEENTYNERYYNAHYHLWTNGTSAERLRQSVTHWKMNQQTLIPLSSWNTFGLHWNGTIMQSYRTLSTIQSTSG